MPRTNESGTKLVIATVVLRVPEDEDVAAWSVSALETKGGWYDDIEGYEYIEVPNV